MAKSKKVLQMKNQARHGDILLQRVEAVPSDADQIGQSKMALAEGTATGHKHMMAGQGVVFYRAKSGDVYVKVQKQALLTHEEHATIRFGLGAYRVVHQVEFDAQENAWQVAD